MHVYMTTLLMLFSFSTNYFWNIIIFIAGSSIILGTLFTKRHYLLDVVGGLVVGFTGYFLAIYIFSLI